MKLLILSSFCIHIVSCATLKEVPEANLISDCYHTPKQKGGSARVYVDVVDDSILTYHSGARSKETQSFAPSDGQILFNRSFDIDVMIVPFKYRPATQNLPRQLTVDSNGILFFGYRGDQYKLVLGAHPVS
jgi:hypothetical protein